QALDGLVVGHDYNRETQLEDDVRLIHGLTGIGIGAVSMSFFLLDDPALEDGPVGATFDLDDCTERAQGEAFAAIAHGTFEAFTDVTSYASADVTPLCAAVSP
ncbi:MAG TPA: hypothetical protein VGO62_12115, partial [Myxococcota bacterium]